MTNQCNINTLSKRIPQDILREHIMPYTYKKQCSSLLLDIKSFRYDYGLIEDLYCTQFNASICLRDLINFCNNGEELIINEETQLIETIFSLDGLGLLSFESIINRDYAVVFASLYIFSFIGLIINLISDLLYHWIDPRIDFEKRQL